MLDRKHFNEIADIIRRSRHHGDDTRRFIASCLADFSLRQNCMFDRERFMAACDVEE